MKKVEFYPKTESVVIFLDENIKDKIEAYRIAVRMITKEIIRYEFNSNYDPNR